MILRHENINHLLQQFPIDGFDESIVDHLCILSQHSLRAVLESGGLLPALPPLEQHPYQRQVKLTSDITGIMIGTFPPISYLCDTLQLPNLTFGNQVISAPDIPYFHGNYSSLWKYTPIGFERIKLNSREEQPQLIENVLKNAGILYTDIISFCQRKLESTGGITKYTASDKLLNSIEINSGLIAALMGNHKVNRLYFTNASFFSTNNSLINNQGFYQLRERDAFGLFIKGAHDHGIMVEFSVPNDPDTWFWINERQMSPGLISDINHKLQKKVALKLRLSKDNITKTFEICTAVSPAAVNRGMVRRNQCVLNYSNIHALDISVAPTGILTTVLQSFFANNITNLYQYNAE